MRVATDHRAKTQKHLQTFTRFSARRVPDKSSSRQVEPKSAYCTFIQQTCTSGDKFSVGILMAWGKYVPSKPPSAFLFSRTATFSTTPTLRLAFTWGRR